MSLPKTSRYVVIGAGIHGLSTAWNLAEELQRRGTGWGDSVIVLDKTNVGAGASGIACGVVRNNYFQPAMRELMEHSVSVWESDPDAFSYHGVGYMQLGPEVMHGDVAKIYEEQRSIGYPSTLVEGETDCAVVHGGSLLGLAGEEHHLRPSRETRRVRQQRRLDATGSPPRPRRPASASSRERRCSGSATTAPVR